MKLLLLSLLSLSSIAMADAQQFGELAINRYGVPLEMDQPTAVKFCAQKGMRLPTIQELSKIALQNGAKGDCDAAKDKNCAPINSVMADGSHASFNFNSDGYRPNYLIHQISLWTSSIYVTPAPSDLVDSRFAYVLIGENGYLWPALLDHDSAVLCVK